MYNNVLMTNEMHNSYNQFYSTVFCLLYMFRTNLVVRNMYSRQKICGIKLIIRIVHLVDH